jgi:hypothetical protein
MCGGYMLLQSTFLDNYMSVEKAHEYGHTHFSEDIFKALKDLPPILQGRVVALTEGF